MFGKRRLGAGKGVAAVFVVAASGLTLGGGVLQAHAATGSIWLQTIDSCKQALGGAEYQIVDTSGNFNVTVTTPPQSSLHSLSSSNTCPLQRGNCATVNYGCVQVTGLPLPDSLTIHEIATPPPTPGNPLGFAPCNGGSACRSESDAASVDGGGNVTASTTNVYPDGTSAVYPSSGTFAGTAADPIVFHNFGLGSGNCDGDSDADDQLTGGNSPHCAYPESSEASAFQPYPWSAGVPESANHFVLNTPTSATAGTPFSATISAFDADNDTADNYTSTENLVWSGPTHAPNGAKPSYPAAANFTNGVATVSITLFDVQTTNLSVVQGSLSGTATGITVGPGATTQFILSTPGTQIANKPFNVKLTAKDAWSNLTPGYTGNTLTWSGPSKSPSGATPVFPSTISFTNGAGTASVTLVDAQSTSLSVTDGVAKGKSATFTVQPAAPSQLLLANPPGSNVTAGTPFVETVSALDPYGNVATAYAGGHSLTWSGPSNAPSGTAPAYPTNPVTFTAGTFSGQISLFDVQKVSLTVVDDSSPALTGTSSQLSINAPTTADHFTLSTPTMRTAGSAFTEKITAVDAYGNVVKTYAGHPTFTGAASSPNGTPPVYSAANFSSGSATVTITLYNAQSTTLTVSDGAVSGATGAFSVRAAAFGFAIANPGTQTAGTSFGVTVSVQDAYGNLNTSYNHHPAFSGPSSSPNGNVPTYSTLNFSGGRATSTVTLFDAQSTSLSLTDVTLTGSSGAFTVNPSAFSLSLSYPGAQTAGQGFTETVTVHDAYGNTNYTGSASISGLDAAPDGTLPTYSQNPLVFSNGSATVTVTPYDAETVSLTVGDGTISASSLPFTVQHALYAFTLSNPGSPTAGTAFTENVTVQDAYSNVDTAYSGAHSLTWSGPSPAPIGTVPVYPTNPLTFTAGVASGQVTLYDAQSTSLALNDGAFSGTSTTFTVSTAAALSFIFGTPSPGPQAAGASFNEQITVQDAYGNVDTAYSGTPIITGPDNSPNSTAPQYSGLTFTNGSTIASITLYDAESTSLNVKDTGSGISTGVSGAFTVGPATTSTTTPFSVSIPTNPATPFVSVTVYVFALDSYGNTATGDTSTLNVTTSDALATGFPSAITLSAGQANFSITFVSLGTQSVTVSGTDSETGQSGSATGSTTVQ